MTLFEGAEILARQGFAPRRTVMIISSHDEEVRGEGARAAAAWMKAKGIRAEFVLDEGQAVISDNPITGGPVALIGLAEKGYATLKVTARAPGGHSSAPPEGGGGVVTLSKAVTAIAEHPFPMKFSGPARGHARSPSPCVVRSLRRKRALPTRFPVAPPRPMPRHRACCSHRQSGVCTA